MCDSYCSDDPKDCDFRIETQTMEDEDTGELYADYHAVCQKCGRHESPWAMNDMVAKLSKPCRTCRWSGGGCQDEAHFSGDSCATYEHFDVLNDRIDALQTELEKEREETEGWRLQVVAAKERIKELQAELEAEKSCGTCRFYRDARRLVIESDGYYCENFKVHGYALDECIKNGFKEWEPHHA